MCIEGGADCAYTEMVSAAALLHGHGPTRHLMERMEGEGPLVCQIFGSTDEEAAFAAREIEKVKDRFCGIDLNAGCPMPRIIKSGAGASLVTDPARVFRMLSAMRENTSLPVSLKTRLGPHRGVKTIFELASAAESAGAVSIAVHARYTSQMHGGPVDLETLAELKSRTGLEVLGNGSVRTSGDLDAMLATGVDGVMVGRAALSDPFVFSRLKGIAQTPPADPVSMAERHLGYILRFRRLLEEKHPADHVPGEDAFASVKMHLHLFRYFNGLPGAAKLRAGLSSIRTLDGIRQAFIAFASAI